MSCLKNLRKKEPTRPPVTEQARFDSGQKNLSVERNLEQIQNPECHHSPMTSWGEKVGRKKDRAREEERNR